MKHFTFLLILAATLPGGMLRAQVPQLVNYQGRVAVDSVNFEGAGQFKFALVNGNGSATLWSNDGTSAGGSEPAAPVTLDVENGLYSVLLGDTLVGNMIPISASAFTNADVRLRVWFDDGVHGSQLLTPDQRLAPAAYLADGAVTTAAIAPGAVNGTSVAPGSLNGFNIATGSLTSSHLTVPAAPNPGQVLGFDGNGFNWTTPSGGGGPIIWQLNGASAFYNAGNVGIGTNTPATKLEVRTPPGFNGFSHSAGTKSIGSYLGGSASGATGGWFGTFSDDPLYFFTNNGQPSVTVTTAGTVGIGPAATAPFATLTVDGTIGFSTVASPMLYIYPSGNANAEKPVIIHSPAFPGYGLFYEDIGDRFSMKSSPADTTPSLVVDLDSNWVAIATDLPKPGYELSVNGQIVCEELLIQDSDNWPDYVFAPEYQLKPLDEVEAHIQHHGHLPGVPSAAEVSENGLSVGSMQRQMMEKIEELTLYVIEQNKRLAAQEQQIAGLQETLQKEGPRKR